ncbi:hypothetical protein AB0H76_02435 [Nocardia sp. NPDC050712]|uniref:hypothetical protein n=1 Tax=Nocardia sp. NPDC050712 TaxID=3155518 RepID=UPI0033EDDE18
MASGFDWDEMLAFLRQARFEDLLLPCHLDRDRPIPLAAPWFFTAYLATDLGYLQVRMSDDHGSLLLSVTPEVVPEEDWVQDDNELILCSIETQLLGSVLPARCTGLRYWTNGESDLARGRIRCLELSFGDQTQLVLDAMRIDGIRMGTAGDAERWLDDMAGGPNTVHEWRR